MLWYIDIEVYNSYVNLNNHKKRNWRPYVNQNIKAETKCPPRCRRHIFKDNFLISNKFAWKYVHKGLIGNVSALV